MFMETAYGGAPIGRRILGTPKTVRAQTAASMQGFLDRQYRGPEMVLAAAGAVDHDAGRRGGRAPLRLDFGGEPATPADPGRYTGGDERKVRKLEQAHLVLGFEGRSFYDQDHYTLHVFSNLLGGGMSSRLFQEIREKRGLCYEVYSFHQPFSDTGIFAVYGGTGEEELGEFMPVMLDCVRAAAEQAHRGRGRPRQGADQGVAADGAGILGAPGRADGPPRPRLRPRCAARGDRGRDRRDHHRGCQPRRGSPCWRRPPTIAAVGPVPQARCRQGRRASRLACAGAPAITSGGLSSS